MRALLPSFLIFYLMACAGITVMAQTVTLQDIGDSLGSLPEIVIYPARVIVTLDPDKPTANAVAVVDDRTLAVGSLDELKTAAGEQPYTVTRHSPTRLSYPALSPSMTTRCWPHLP